MYVVCQVHICFTYALQQRGARSQSKKRAASPSLLYSPPLMVGPVVESQYRAMSFDYYFQTSSYNQNKQPKAVKINPFLQFCDSLKYYIFQLLWKHHSSTFYLILICCNQILLHFVAFFHVASLFSTWVDNKKVGVDNEKALELTNSNVFHRGRQ